ncbi:hypothetical protein GOBAR_DD28643 [Gossypium barbadense]|nr:hypothetical protein GOBAR_DD28643 [Gossypium barbadense]
MVYVARYREVRTTWGVSSDDRGVFRGFVWMLYSVPDVVDVIPQWAHAHSIMWCFNVPLLNLSIIEWPSVHYQQRYLENELPYLFDGYLMVVPRHIHPRRSQQGGSSQPHCHQCHWNTATQTHPKVEAEPQPPLSHS